MNSTLAYAQTENATLTNTSTWENRTFSNNTTPTEGFGTYGLAILVPAFVYMTAIALLAVIGNSCTLIVIYNNPHLQIVSSLFVLSFTFAGFIEGFFLPITLGSVVVGYWPYSDGVCMFKAFITTAMSLVTINTLSLFSIDRYIAVTMPLHYTRRVTKNRVAVVLAIMWLLCLGVVTAGLIIGAHAYLWEYMTCIIEWQYSRVYALFTFGLLVIPAILIVVFCYYRILKVARKHLDNMKQAEHNNEINEINLSTSKSSHDTGPEIPRNIVRKARLSVVPEDVVSEPNQDTMSIAPIVHVKPSFKPRRSISHDSHFSREPLDKVRKARALRTRFELVGRQLMFNRKIKSTRKKLKSSETRAAMTVLIVTGAFYICWVPMLLVQIYGLTGRHISPHAALFSSWITLISTVCNPFVYNWRNQAFKRAYRKLWLSVKKVLTCDENLYISENNIISSQALSSCSRLGNQSSNPSPKVSFSHHNIMLTESPGTPAKRSSL